MNVSSNRTISRDAFQRVINLHDETLEQRDGLIKFLKRIDHVLTNTDNKEGNMLASYLFGCLQGFKEDNPDIVELLKDS